MSDSDSEVNFNLNNVERRGEDVPKGIDVGRGDDGDQRRRTRSFAHIKPDSFTGTEDWDQYLSYFEDCAELCQWSDREKLLYLATSLKQQARVHYSSLPLEEKNSFRALSFSLEQRFGSKRQQSRWISKLQNRSRERNETIGAFGDEIRLYSQKAYVTLDQEAQEMLALQQFYKNVSPEMRCRLMDRDCRSIREAVEIVERYEEVIGKAEWNAKPSQVRGLSNCNFVSDRSPVAGHQAPLDDMSCIKRSIQNIEQRLYKLETKEPSKQYSSGRTCYKCGSGSHLYRDCPKRIQEEAKFSKYQGNANPSSQ